jgi:vancomycin permeability regulator SanA
LLILGGLTDEIGAAEVAVVFGNTVNPDGQPSVRLQARLDKALELYRQGLFANIFVSGGIGSEGFDEALVMKQYLVERGVPESSVISDNHGNNTYQTARNVAFWMKVKGYHSVLSITQYTHIPRARLALRRFGIEKVYSAHADIFEMRDPYSLVREMAAWVVYFVRKFG